MCVCVTLHVRVRDTACAYGCNGYYGTVCTCVTVPLYVHVHVHVHVRVV